METNHTEMRHQLREVDEMNSEAVTPWRDALHRIFSRGSQVPAAEKAQILGVPGRRQFFRVGGATMLGAAVLAACGDDDGDTASTGETDDTSGDTTETTEGEGGGVDDLTLARTAASLEALAVSAYMTAGESGIVTNADVAAAAELFASHHSDHQGALNGVITENGGEEVTEPNAAVNEAMVQPAVEEATDLAESDPEAAQNRIVQLAYDLETAAAQTYVFAAGQLTTADLRSTIMTIGGVESRHAIILANVLGLAPEEQYPSAFYNSDNPLPENAIIS